MKKLLAAFLAVMTLTGVLTMSAMAAPADHALIAPNPNAVISPNPAADAKAVQLAQAHALKHLRLFRGSDIGLELDRAPTRMEAVIMLIRLLGLENDALYGEWEHPFTDAPTWQTASEYLGYAYEKGLTQGVSATSFDPNSPASFRQCVVFALRALHFKDTDTEKVWDSWDKIADKIGLVPELVNEEKFLRGDTVLLYYNALEAKLADDNAKTLAASLIESGVFTEDEYAVAKLIAEDKINLSSSLEEISAAIYAGVDYDFSHMAVVGTEINKDNEEYYLGTAELAYERAIVNEPMLTARAHSVYLIQMKEGSDMAAAKDLLLKSINPARWICVSVEKENIRIENIGNLIVVVLDNDCPDQLLNSFKALAD